MALDNIEESIFQKIMNEITAITQEKRLFLILKV